MNSTKKSLITSVFAELSQLQRKLLDDKVGCSIPCRAMQLGALAKLLDGTSLLNHSPEKEYQALSVKQLENRVQVAVCPTWSEGDIHYKRTALHQCLAPGNAFSLATRAAASKSMTWKGLDMTKYGKSATL